MLNWKSNSKIKLNRAVKTILTELISFKLIMMKSSGNSLTITATKQLNWLKEMNKTIWSQWKKWQELERGKTWPMHREGSWWSLNKERVLLFKWERRSKLSLCRNWLRLIMLNKLNSIFKLRTNKISKSGTWLKTSKINICYLSTHKRKRIIREESTIP